jgi:endonuclease-3
MSGPIMESLESKKSRIKIIIKRLRKIFPNVKCALNYETPFQLLVATILSAQCTDERVNKVTEVMFKKLKAPSDYVKVSQAKLEEYVHSAGFYRNKAKNIKAMAHMVLEKYNGELPRTMEELVQLPGAGRKTANVVLGNAFGIPGMPVDTHMLRVNKRLGLCAEKDPVKMEFALMELVPKKDWTDYSHLIIHLGRAECDSRKPLCAQCVLKDLCPQNLV